MNIARDVAKNTIFLMSANIISGILTLILTIFVARFLGDVEFGVYGFATALIGILIVISNIGLNLVIIKDVARNKSLDSKYLGNVAVIEVFLAAIFFLVVILILNIINYPDNDRTVVYIVSLAILIEQTFIALHNSIYISYGKMEYQSLILAVEKIIFFILGMYVLIKGYGLVPFVFIYLLSAISGFILAVFITFRKFTVPKFEIDFKLWKYLILTALSFGLAGALNLIYARADMVLLSVIKGSEVVGWYNAANTLVGSISYIGVAFTTAIFPLMSNAFISSKKLLYATSEKAFKYSLIFLIPSAIGVTLLSNEIIILLYGHDFINAAIILKILIWSGAISFINSIFYTILGSTDRQKVTAIIMGIGAVANVLLNLILIPGFSYIGAGIAVVLTQVICLVFAFHFQSEFLSEMKIVGTIIKSLIASTFMAATIIYLNYLNLFLLVGIAILTYIIIFIAIKGFNKEDWDLFRDLIERNR